VPGTCRHGERHDAGGVADRPDAVTGAAAFVNGDAARRDDRIESHVQLCWLALLLLRIAETEAADTWRNIRNELDRMHLVTLATSAGTVSQRTELTHRQRQILGALDLPEPARFYDFTPLADPAE